MSSSRASGSSLYGNKNMNANISVQILGGTKTISGAYTYHTFTTSSVVFATTVTLNIEYMLVGGGGGGGGSLNAQALSGYGGETIIASATLVPGAYAITVGAGGSTAGGTSAPSNGGSSIISGTLFTATARGGSSGTSSNNGVQYRDANWSSGYRGGPVTNNFTGTSTTYGTSGSGGALNSPAPGAVGIGGGGGASWSTTNYTGTTGNSGTIVIRYIL